MQAILLKLIHSKFNISKLTVDNKLNKLFELENENKLNEDSLVKYLGIIYYIYKSADLESYMMEMFIYKSKKNNKGEQIVDNLLSTKDNVPIKEFK